MDANHLTCQSGSRGDSRLLQIDWTDRNVRRVAGRVCSSVPSRLGQAWALHGDKDSASRTTQRWCFWAGLCLSKVLPGRLRVQAVSMFTMRA